MNIRTFIALTVSVLALASQTVSLADIAINTSIIYFEPGEPNRQDVEVENISDSPAYVKIEPTVVRDPGTEQQTRVPYTNPKEAGLLVSPNKLVIPPNGRKLIRFVNLQPNADKERVYRVKISPVLGDLVSEQSGVKILVGYEVLVLVHPEVGGPNLVGVRNGKKLLLRNEGTTNVLVREGVQCPESASSESECVYITGKRLYPGNEFEMELPYDLSVRLYTNTGLRNTIQVID